MCATLDLASIVGVVEDSALRLWDRRDPTIIKGESNSQARHGPPTAIWQLADPAPARHVVRTMLDEPALARHVVQKKK